MLFWMQSKIYICSLRHLTGSKSERLVLLTTRPFQGTIPKVYWYAGFILLDQSVTTFMELPQVTGLSMTSYLTLIECFFMSLLFAQSNPGQAQQWRPLQASWHKTMSGLELSITNNQQVYTDSPLSIIIVLILNILKPFYMYVHFV